MELKLSRKTFYIGQAIWSVLYTAISFYYLVTRIDYEAFVKERTIPDELCNVMLYSFVLYITATGVLAVIAKFKLKEWNWRDAATSVAVMLLSVPVGIFLLITMFRIFY